jgi:AraC-like DNA-binding protein
MIRHEISAHSTATLGIIAVTARSARGFARHTHDQFGIGVVESGAQTSASGRGQVRVKAGDLITVNPGEVHDGLPVDERGRVWRMLYLDPQVMKRLTGRQEDFAFPVLRRPGLADGFRRLLWFVCDPAQGLSTEAELVRLSAALDDRPPKPASPGGVALALQALRDDPARPVSLGDLAALAGLTRFHFLRSFAKATGLTPHAFQMQARLHLARRLIMTGLPLSAAAADAGFADQSHLTRFFARSYGMTPGAYARNFVQDRGMRRRG